MVKTTLSKVKFRDISTVEFYHFIGNRIGQYYNERNVSSLYTKYLDRIAIYYNKGTKLQPKESIEINNKTGGWPKESNFYGHRVKILPVISFTTLYAFPNRNGRGRLTRLFMISKLRYSSGSNNKIPNQLINLTEWSNNNPYHKVDRKIYNFFFNTDMYILAYNKLKSNPGNLTPGIVPETLDGLSYDWIIETINSFKNESFQFKPGRRIEIDKPNGGNRPLIIAPPRDKIVQEIMRIILQAIFEPGFSLYSHGFRQNKSSHTALRQIKTNFSVSTWVIEGDIKKCFDSINHHKLMAIIENKISDRRFTRLIWKSLRAGYFSFNHYNHSISGTPQGSVVSPILCNIFLDIMDKYVEKLIKEFNTSKKSPRLNPKYQALIYKKSKSNDARNIHQELRKIPSYDPLDPEYKRMVYVRYADDWVIGVRGSYQDAMTIMNNIRLFLHAELELELSIKKTVITNIRTDKVMFLGVNFFKTHANNFVSSSRGRPMRSPLSIRFEAPINRILSKLQNAGFCKGITPIPKFVLMANSKDQIIHIHNAVIRGILNYYSFVHNYGKLVGLVNNIIKGACSMLLAAKFNLKSQKAVYSKYGKNLKGNDKVAFIQVKYKVSTWKFNIAPLKGDDLDIVKSLYTMSKSIASLENLVCKVCGSDYRVEMHHIRKMADLNPTAKYVDKLMAKAQRKQIPLCRNCHMKHHNS